MSFLEEIEPYRKYVNEYLKTGAHPNREIRLILSGIELRLKEAEKLTMYGKTNIEILETDISCGGCVRTMMNNLARWIRIKELETPKIHKETVEFKGVPPIVDLTKLKWGELRKYATSKGVSVNGKKKQEIIDEVNAL